MRFRRHVEMGEEIIEPGLGWLEGSGMMKMVHEFAAMMMRFSFVVVLFGFRCDLFASLFACLLVCLFVCLPVCLSVCLSVCLFVCWLVGWLVPHLSGEGC